VIILGDFGLIWDPPNNISKKEEYWLKWLSDKPWTTLTLDGNHENHTRLDALPVVEKWGAPVGAVNDSIFHLRRGYVYNINGFSFFTFGGANSIDKEGRVPELSWWSREIPSFMEEKRGLNNLKAVGDKVDFILAHECPTSIIVRMVSHHIERYGLTDYLQEVVDITNFKQYFFGHHHQDKKINDKFMCLYRKIVEIE